MLLGWMLFRLRGKLTRKIIPIRETLAKFFFLCNSVEERQGETKRSPSVWPDHQHILYPSSRPAPPPKQRLTKRASLKGLLDYAIKIAATWVACKKLHARIARPFTLRIQHWAIFKRFRWLCSNLWLCV